MAKDNGTTLWVSTKLAEEIRQLAKDERRTVKTIIELALEAYMEKKGK